MSQKRASATLDMAKCQAMVANCACFNFRKASRSVTQLFDQTLAPIGVRSTQLVLVLAAQVMGPCALARLARELVMDRSTITRNINPLVKLGLLQVTGKSGRSGKSVEITRAGQQLLADAEPYWQTAQAQLLERMGQDRWTRVMGDLSSVVEATRETA